MNGLPLFHPFNILSCLTSSPVICESIYFPKTCPHELLFNILPHPHVTHLGVYRISPPRLSPSSSPFIPVLFICHYQLRGIGDVSPEAYRCVEIGGKGGSGRAL